MLGDVYILSRVTRVLGGLYIFSHV